MAINTTVHKDNNFTPADYLGFGVIATGCMVGASVPVGVYMLLKDASQDVKMVLAGGVVFSAFALISRLIESKVQISKERSEAYRDAVQIARDLYRPAALVEPDRGGPRFIESAAQFERQVFGEER